MGASLPAPRSGRLICSPIRRSVGVRQSEPPRRLNVKHKCRKQMKVCVIRHGHAPSRSAAEAERAIEKAVRQESRREIRTQLED